MTFSPKLIVRLYSNKSPNELSYNCAQGSSIGTNMPDDKKFKGIKFSKEVKEEAIVLAAYDIVKQMHEAGLIYDDELKYIQNKYSIPVE